jgi:glycyl-tRNA synthetase
MNINSFREFTLAEIEHFLDPDNKKHEKFHLVKDVVVPLQPRALQLQEGGQLLNITVGEAVEQVFICKVIALIYFY